MAHKNMERDFALSLSVSCDLYFFLKQRVNNQLGLKSLQNQATDGLLKRVVSNLHNEIFQIALQHSKKPYCSLKE